MDSLSEAEQWEQGSRSDRLRNEFVVPALGQILNASAPPRLLDVGAGTGYVARAIDRLLSFRANWTLADVSAGRLELAVALRPEDMSMQAVVGDVFAWPFDGRRFDAVLLSFTLLEIEDSRRLLTTLRGELDAGALLLIVLPDAWADVLRYSRTDPSVIERYLSASVAVPKVDRFTRKQYPFHAMRTESLIEAATEGGFDLFTLQHGVVGSAAAFVLGFRRRA